MPAVFVHGVPDTPALWNPLLAHLERDDVALLQLPGFGTPRPGGFAATKEAYADWVVAALETLDAPIDLVGHDWGALLVQRVASARPDLIRTWACGSAAVDPQYVWHDMARAWQTPEVGEQVMGAMEPEAMAAFFAEEIGEQRARAVASHVDDTMKGCILALYRSAVNVGQDWGPAVDAMTRPGLVLWGRNDPYVSPQFAERLAQRTGAELVIYDDAAHWWPVTKAKDAAARLDAFWANLA